MAHYYDTGAGLAFNEHGLDVLPPGWTEITEGDYNTQLAVIDAANDAAKQAQVDAKAAEREHAYDVLTASVHSSDWDDATIRLITGWYN